MDNVRCIDSCPRGNDIAALKFCFKTCVAMKFVDDDDDEDIPTENRIDRLRQKNRGKNSTK